MSEVKFIPPQQNPLLTRLIQSIFYLVAYFVYKIRLVVAESEIAKLKELSDRRVVYLPNHSNLDDGFALFLLSARVGQLFNYVVAIEAFQGWVGKLLQKVGAYSIRRGMGDRSSILQTLKILQQPQCKLVIFPEGGCSYQNATVMPFRPGAFELSFKALAKLVGGNASPRLVGTCGQALCPDKLVTDAPSNGACDPPSVSLTKDNCSVPDFYLVPISLKYSYPNGTDEVIAQALTRLETALALTPQEDDLYSRLRLISIHVLTRLEAEYRVLPTTLTDTNQRIKVLKQRMLDYCEEKLSLTPVTQLPNRERVYRVQATLRSLSQHEQDSVANYQYLYLTTVRLLNFDAIYDGYVAENPTRERFFDTIDRLEREVFQRDRPKFKGRRQVEIKVATPINLKDYWHEYQTERHSPQQEKQSFSNDLAPKQPVIERLTKLSQQLIQANLN